jgi:RNA-binding protein
MMTASMTGKQRRYLRTLGQRLTPTLHVGHEGVSDAVVQQADAQLETHELARRTRADLTQVLGRSALLYRARAKEPTITLP